MFLALYVFNWRECVGIEPTLPKKLLTPHTGFEDQREHQNPSTPLIKTF